MSDADLGRFGQIVRNRREELQLQQEDLRSRGGPSSTTMSGIERGMTHPSPSTLRKLDHGLRWQAGSAARALAGDSPTPLAPQTSTQKPARVSQTTTSNARLSVAEALAILDASTSATEQIRELIEIVPSPPPSFQRKLNEILDRMKQMPMMAVLACELIGEALAEEDITDNEDVGGLASRLDGHVHSLISLRDVVRRMADALQDSSSSGAPDAAEDQEGDLPDNPEPPRYDRWRDGIDPGEVEGGDQGPQ